MNRLRVQRAAGQMYFQAKLCGVQTRYGFQRELGFSNTESRNARMLVALRIPTEASTPA